jgi:hypothetical protein
MKQTPRFVSFTSFREVVVRALEIEAVESISETHGTDNGHTFINFLHLRENIEGEVVHSRS